MCFSSFWWFHGFVMWITTIWAVKQTVVIFLGRPSGAGVRYLVRTRIDRSFVCRNSFFSSQLFQNGFGAWFWTDRRSENWYISLKIHFDHPRGCNIGGKHIKKSKSSFKIYFCTQTTYRYESWPNTEPQIRLVFPGKSPPFLWQLRQQSHQPSMDRLLHRLSDLGFSRNSSIFDRLYLRAQGELEARKTCFRKP